VTEAVGRRYKELLSDIAVFPNGHAAGIIALKDAARSLANGAYDVGVIAGVDSYFEPETMEWIEECDQFHGTGPLNNAWGFIPGEAAGAVLVTGVDLSPLAGASMLGRVLAVGTGFEHKRIKTETVCTGQGLTQAFHGALTGLPAGTKVTDIYCDMNGEPYRADEYGFACLRSDNRFATASEFVSPADCWGDVGAATGPLCLALAAIAASKGYARGDHALAWASSEGGERGAALIRTGSED
jgi:3-oxoacyl-[acyl-carrier-protein] synthase-1